MMSRAADGATAKASQPVVSALDESDLPEAARIVRLAFGTFIGVPDPENFWNDRDYVYGRHRAAHVASFGAKLNGQLVGSNFATRWGSVGFFGPLTVRPELQERGVARALLARTMEQFDSWGTRHVGLFTFAQSAKHIALYQKHGFSARFLTAIMSAPVAARRGAAGWSRFSQLSEARQNEALRSCRDVAATLYPGLDLTEEIGATHAQGLGDTVLVEGAGGIAAFAVCHYGRAARPERTIASSSSARCAAERRPKMIIPGCSMRAKLWRPQSACRKCWRARTWRATRPIGTLSRADTARRSRA